MGGMSRTGRGRGRARAEIAVVRVLEKRLGALPVVAEFGRRLRIAEIVDELCPVRRVVWISHAPCPARRAGSRQVPHREHSVGGGTSSRSSGSGARDSPVPGCPGCRPRLRSLRRSLSEDWRAFRSALRRSRAPIGSFDGGIPEVVLSDPSRRSSSATLSSSRRYRSS